MKANRASGKTWWAAAAPIVSISCPTYSLGNLYSAQLWRTILSTIPGLDDKMRTGDTAPILAWLREHVHRYGQKYTPDELILRATGEPLNPAYYMEYLREKFGELY